MLCIYVLKEKCQMKMSKMGGELLSYGASFRRFIFYVGCEMYINTEKLVLPIQLPEFCCFKISDIVLTFEEIKKFK